MSYNFSNVSQIHLPQAQKGTINLDVTLQNQLPQFIPFTERLLEKENGQDLKNPSILPIPLSNTQIKAIVKEFAPIVIHEKGRKPEEDVPISVTFDKNEDPKDNKINFDKQQILYPSVYGELTAETSDSYYLTYIFYHISDYDQPYREFFLSSTFHEHDLEGFHIRIDKNYLIPVEAETWFHNRFFYCGSLLFADRSMKKKWDRPLFYLNLYKNKNPLIFILKGGHGVRCAQKKDFVKLNNKFVFIPDSEELPIGVNKEDLLKKEFFDTNWKTQIFFLERFFQEISLKDMLNSS